jgi:RND family efflux transporter MFP subunit
MTQSEIKAKLSKAKGAPAPDWPAASKSTAPLWPPEPPIKHKTGWISRVFRILLTLFAIAVAIPLGLMMWDVYMGAPWTRDGAVRAYVVTMAPEVSGRIVELPVRDNQFVHKGDLLMVIDPTDYRIAVTQAEATVEQTRAIAENSRVESERREKLTTLSTSDETKQIYQTKWLATEASHRQAVASLEQARVNLERTRIISPVNGYVTNLLAQLGDYVTIGQNKISLVDADSYWVDGYFEETNLGGIRVGDPASIRLMGYDQIIRGHVNSVARGINVANAQPNNQGLATVNPIFTWVRLAQRVPVRVNIDQVPEGVVLSAGMTATVQIDPRPSSKTGEAAIDQARSSPPPEPAAPSKTERRKKASPPTRH